MSTKEQPEEAIHHHAIDRGDAYVSAEKTINTPATDGFGLRSDRVANTETLRSEGDGPNPEIRTLTPFTPD
ncbi:uncharacterized [Tachysurus ichikawai]